MTDKKPETPRNIIERLLAAQAQYPSVPKNGVGQVGQRKYKYALLADLLAAVIPVWNAEGILYSRTIEYEGTQMYLVSQARCSYHPDQAMAVRTVSYPLGEIGMSHQELGAAITYGARYSLLLLTGLCPDDDVDGDIAATTGVKLISAKQGIELDSMIDEINKMTPRADGASHVDTMLTAMNIKGWGDVPASEFKNTVKRIEVFADKLMTHEERDNG